MQNIWEKWPDMAQNDPQIGPLMSKFNAPLKVTKIDMYIKTDAKPGEIFYLFFILIVPQIGLLRPLFFTHLKVFAMSMWSNTDVKPLKTFWENYQTPEFLLTLGPKMAKKLYDIIHISESRFNEHIKQDWC